MKELIKDISVFVNCKRYLLITGLTALCCYGFAITHAAIGMDDTAIPLYFEEGIAPLVGRWCLFVLHNIFHITLSSFTPWMVELISVLIFMLSVTLWCVLWRRICEPKAMMPVWNYAFVAALFLSCPLISEVFVFYLHNGICTGYGMTALALLCLLASLQITCDRKQKAKKLVLSSFLLSVALGFYESFIIVYLMGAVMAFFLLRRLYGKKDETCRYQTNILPWFCNGSLTVIGSLLLRTVILAILNFAFQLSQRLEQYQVLYRPLFGDNFRVSGTFLMNLKRFWLLYYVNGIVYFPITVLVTAFAAAGLYSLYFGIRKKDILLPFCCISLVLSPLLMCIIEGLPTRYRSSQYVPVVAAFAVLLLFIELSLHKKPKWVSPISYALLSILIYNQCADMNRWFYVDYLKYQNMTEVMTHIAYDLKSGFDTSKPLIFRGAYRVPYEISKDAYCSFSSPQFRWISLITDFVDPHLKEKYYAPNGYGYTFAESPVISTLQWGVTAFDGTCGQLIEFWKMHGYSFSYVTDLDVIAEAEQIRSAENMPGYPQNGYIKEYENYIIINLETP